MNECVYLDSCVLNRLTDDLTQERLRLEAVAILRVLDAVAAGTVEWVASTAVLFELNRNTNPYRRNDATALLSLASSTAQPGVTTTARVAMLQAAGLGGMDALHLALAEEAKVTTLLTVDDRFIRRAVNRLAQNTVHVENPVNWIRRREPWLIKR